MTTSPHSKDPSHLPQTPPAKANRVVNHFPESLPYSQLSTPETPASRSKSTCAPYSPYLNVLQEEPKFSPAASSINFSGAEVNTDTDSSDSEALNAKFESDLEMREHHSTSSCCSTTPTTATCEDGGENDEPDDALQQQHESGQPPEQQQNQSLSHSPRKNGFEYSRSSGLMNNSNDSSANRRWLILMEPIAAVHIAVILGAKGRIFRTDDSLATLLGYECTNRLFGTEIHKLIPSLNLSAEFVGKEQHCCGVTVKKNGIPLSIVVDSEFIEGMCCFPFKAFPIQ